VLLIQLRQVGDVVLTTPIARILKEARPGCRVSFLTEPPSNQLLARNPFIDEVLLNNREGGWVKTLRLGRELRAHKYDAVLDFMANPRSALLAFLSRAPTRISYAVKGRGVLYTERVETQPAYAVEIKKQLLAPLGVQGEQDRPEIFLGDEDKEWGEARRKELTAGGNRRLVTVDPSHRRATRCWPASHYGDLCRRMAREHRLLPVVLWGPGEETVADEVVSASGGEAVKAPPTQLRQMAALIAAADLHVGNCSAPRHIAVAVGTPTFTILGSTSAGWTYPTAEHSEIALGLDCQPCNRNECPRDYACLRGLPPEDVSGRLTSWANTTLGWDSR
jgi:ADP-heptose:LPS heptosyltransferase